MEKIKDTIDEVDDLHTLDRILALLMQADTSTRALETDIRIKEFDRKDHFPPAQKNEVQLRFKKTCGNPGRKKKYTPLR